MASNVDAPSGERRWPRPIACVITLIRQMNRHDLGSYAAALSYNFIFALFPLLLFVAAGLGFLRIPFSAVASSPLAQVMPAATWRAVVSALRDALAHRNAYALWFGFLLFLYGMSGAFRQFMDAVNRMYEFPFPWKRPMVLYYLTSFLLALTVGIGAIVGVLLSVVRPHTIQTMVWGSAPAAPAAAVIDGIRWIALLALFLVLLAVLYWLAPDRRPRFRWVSPGALMMLLAWLVLSTGFSYYAEHLAHYNRIYGTLGQIILLLLYLYLFGLLLLLGAQVNAMNDGRGAPPGGWPHQKRPVPVPVPESAPGPSLEGVADERSGGGGDPAGPVPG